MAINKTAPVTIQQKTANYFEFAHIDTVNAASGVYVDLFWNACTKADDGSITIVENCGPERIASDDVTAVAADAYSRAKAYEAHGVPPGLAYQGGYRDALYAVLQARGKFGA
jgi:hypothetical protein